jgi:hypothetical protein
VDGADVPGAGDVPARELLTRQPRPAPGRQALKPTACAADAHRMNQTAQQLVAVLTAATGLTTAMAVATLTSRRLLGTLVRWTTPGIAALAAAAALALTGHPLLAVAPALAGATLALTAAARTRPAVVPAQAHARATVLYTELLRAAPAGLPAITAPVLILVPDVGGPGVQMCQN